MASNMSKPDWPNFQLNNGLMMPAVGFGTYRIRDPDVMMQVVDKALATGYRLFDTASVYYNEVHLKRALKMLLPKYELEREDIFLVSKLSNFEMGSKEVAIKAYDKSCKNLGVDYLDMYLIHFPGAAKLPHQDSENKVMRNASWSGLIDLYDEGRVSSIGVSNFTKQHLIDLIKDHHGVVPVVNQVEWHPYYHDDEVLSVVSENDIVLQAYHSLGSMNFGANLRSDPVVLEIAKDLSVTPAQVLLVWALQRDVAVIPKSTNPERIQQNYDLDFKLTSDQMRKLNNLKGKAKKYAWDPTEVA